MLKQILGCKMLFLVSLMGLKSGLKAQSCIIEKEVGGFRHPESVVFDGRQFFVSNLGRQLTPLEKDGDGYISRLTRNGALQDTTYFPRVTLHAPKGMAILNDMLYVADVGRIVVLDIQSKNLVREKNLAEVCLFVNDLAARDEERLFFSCSDKGTVWMWDLSADSLFLISQDMPGANGLLWDFLNADLYVAAMGGGGEPGFVYKVDLKNRTSEKIGDAKGLWDGLALVRGRLLCSDWKSQSLQEISLRTRLAQNLNCGKEFHGPADVLYWNGKVYLPAMKEGKMYVLRIEK